MSVPSSIYQTGGSLPINAPTYVKRQADDDLYGWLKKGEFCYVLNSRQMGKSSLRVQIMAKLQKEGVACAALDLTEIGSSDITRDQWYAGVIDSLIGSFQLEENFDLEVWWTSLALLSPSKKLSKFFSEILLTRIVSPIVIFIDEIDSTLKLKFKDDFFSLLRACYNQRADNQEYQRLTFCLFGVASPTDLIADEQSTPFNIGQGVDLKGFQYEEIEPLTRYLQEKVYNPSEIMRDILHWTGGQPFLTQRLCSLVVKANNPTPDVSQIVQQMIIENWEAQDEKAHLITIKNRILNNEQRTGYLLELYRKVLKDKQITINNSSEERELQLSGLVVKKGNILQVYNPVYAKVFNEYWIDTELNKLRPYSESFRTWLLSGKTDDSRLLQGQALLDAEKWASGKQNLGGEDRDFLGASRAKERAIEIEIQEKKAIEQRNILLEEANEEANKKIKKGTIIGASFFGIMLIIASGLGFFAWQAKVEREQIKANIKVADDLSQQAGILQQKDYTEASKDALAQAGLSLTLKDTELKQALSWSGIALTHQYLGQRSLETEDNKPIKDIKYSPEQLEHWRKAKEAIIKSLELLEKEDLTSTDVVPVAFFTYSVLGNLLEEHEFASSQLQQELLTISDLPSKSPKTALDAYKESLKLLENSSIPVAEITELESLDNVTNIYRKLNDSLISESDTNEIRKQKDNLRNLMLASLKKHYLYLTHVLILALETSLKERDWKKADGLTLDALSYSNQSKDINGAWSWRNTSCSDLRKIETLWYNQSSGKFSFKEQWKIYFRLNKNSPDYDDKAYSAFVREVGWETEQKGPMDYNDVNWSKNSPTTSPKGHLPLPPVVARFLGFNQWEIAALQLRGEEGFRGWTVEFSDFLSLTIACEL